MALQLTERLDDDLLEDMRNSQAEMLILESGAVAMRMEEPRVIVERDRSLWARIIEEYGLDPSDALEFNGLSGCIEEARDG